MDAPAAAQQSVQQPLRQRRGVWLLLLAIGLVVIALLVLAWWLIYARYYESTDDAYVSGDLVNVMSQVSGTVISIGADETDRVDAGQELVRLDATDYRIALEDAEQQLARTVRQTHTVFANRDQLLAVVGQRRADFAKAQADFDRRKNLTKSGAVSGEELGHAEDALRAMPLPPRRKISPPALRWWGAPEWPTTRTCRRLLPRWSARGST
jgi:membrane fusion protein, multidrug efflux system